MITSTRRLDSLILPVIQVAAILVLVLPLAGLALAWLAGSDHSAASLLSFDSRPAALLIHSLGFSAAVAAGSMFFGTLIALGLLGSRRGMLVIKLFLPPLLIVSPSLHCLNWSTAIMQFNEWGLRRGLGLSCDGWFGSWLVEILAFLPLAIGLAWAGLASLDSKLLEAAMIFSRPWPVLRRIAGPMIWIALAAGIGIIFILSMADYTAPSLFATPVYALEIFSVYSSGGHPADAIWTALPMMVSIGLAVMLLVKIGSRKKIFTSRSSRWPCRAEGFHSAVAISALVLLLILPITVLAAAAAPWSAFMNAVVNARSELLVSVQVSLAATFCSMTLGIAAGYALQRSRQAMLWWSVVGLLFAMPAPLVAIGILQVAGRLGIWTESLLPVWACTARFMPVVALIVYAVLCRLDTGMIEAARVFQKGRWHGAWRITLPLMAPGLSIAAAAGFALALGELGAMILVAPPGQSTLIIRLYNLLHYGASQDVAALGLTLFLPALAAGTLLTILLRHRRRVIEVFDA